jgi:hypothetical protein
MNVGLVNVPPSYSAAAGAAGADHQTGHHRQHQLTGIRAADSSASQDSE